MLVPNSTEPSLIVSYNHDIVITLCGKLTMHLRLNVSTNVTRYSDEFVITVIVITYFGFIYKNIVVSKLKIIELLFYYFISEIF